jgi:hypothetical protein
MSSVTLPEDLWASQLSASHLPCSRQYHRQSLLTYDTYVIQSVQPKELLTRLTQHSQRSTQYNESLADYFRARSAAEADYAAALNKLARRFADTGVSKGSDGGKKATALLLDRKGPSD